MSETVRTIESLAELSSFEPAWEALADGLASPMQQPIWTQAVAETLVAEKALSVVAVGPASAPTAVAPLVRVRRPTARLELGGVRELHEPSDFLYSGESSLAQLTEAIVATRRPLLLRRIPADSPVPAALRSACGRRGVVAVRPAPGWPAIELDPGWANPEGKLSSRRRSDLRRARRRAEEIGEVVFQPLAPAPTELGPALEEAFRVEAAGWKGRAGTALEADPARGAFFRRYAAAAADKGILRLFFLRIGGVAAAVQIGVETGGRFWLLKMGYDERYNRSSPGLLLMLESVRRCAEAGLEWFELLGTAEAWTRPWTTVVRPCVRLAAYPLRPGSLPALAVDAAVVAGRRLSREADGDR